MAISKDQIFAAADDLNAAGQSPTLALPFTHNLLDRG